MDNETIEALYNSFMQCVNKVEKAETDGERAKWLQAAKDDHAELSQHPDQFSGSQRRRIKRAMAYLDELI